MSLCIRGNTCLYRKKKIVLLFHNRCFRYEKQWSFNHTFASKERSICYFLGYSFKSTAAKQAHKICLENIIFFSGNYLEICCLGICSKGVLEIAVSSDKIVSCTWCLNFLTAVRSLFWKRGMIFPDNEDREEFWKFRSVVPR